MYKENHTPFSHVAYSDTRGDASAMTPTPPILHTAYPCTRGACIMRPTTTTYTFAYPDTGGACITRITPVLHTAYPEVGAESSDNGLIDSKQGHEAPCNYLYHSFCSRSKCQYCPCKQMLNSLHYILHRAINSMSLQYYMWELVKHTFNHGH